MVSDEIQGLTGEIHGLTGEIHGLTDEIHGLTDHIHGTMTLLMKPTSVRFEGQFISQN